MRIFITGGGGQLAKSILPHLQNQTIHVATRTNLDVTDSKQVRQQISEFQPDIVLHFASMTRGDECAKNPEVAWIINVKGANNVVQACRETNSVMLFVSTNEVFDGTKRYPYTENDTPNPITIIGKTKHEAEKIIQKNLSRYFIIRTSWLYSNWSQNFLHSVLRKAVRDKSIVLVDDEVSSPTYSEDLSVAITKLITTKEYGIYHLANKGFVSRLDFAKKAFEIYDINDVDVTPVHLDHFKRISRPPLFSALENSNTSIFGINMPQWENALKRFLSSYNLLSSSIHEV